MSYYKHSQHNQVSQSIILPFVAVIVVGVYTTFSHLIQLPYEYLLSIHNDIIDPQTNHPLYRCDGAITGVTGDR